jgi:hypothetical protein
MMMMEKMNAISTPGYITALKILFVMMMFFKDASRVTCGRNNRKQAHIISVLL